MWCWSHPFNACLKGGLQAQRCHRALAKGLGQVAAWNEQGVSLSSEPGAKQTPIREAFRLLSHLLELLKRNRSKTQKAWLYFCPFSCPLSLAQHCFACGSCRTRLQDSPLPACEIFCIPPKALVFTTIHLYVDLLVLAGLPLSRGQLRPTCAHGGRIREVPGQQFSI